MSLRRLESFVKCTFSYIRSLLLRCTQNRYIKYLPYNPRHDDVYLVSFPKSGNTWMGFLIANAALRLKNIDRDVNFFNSHHFIPDIHDTRDINNCTLPIGFRCIKSHSSFNPLYLSVVYVLRHPEDVMVSYYKFMVGLGSYKGTLSEFIRSPDYGVATWVSHVQGWLDVGNNPSLQIILIRYEDLKVSSSIEIKKVFRFFGFHLDDSILDYVTSKTSFSFMKQLEEELYFNGRHIAKDFKFMRSGKVGANNAEFNKNDIEFIREIAGPLMKKYNYE